MLLSILTSTILTQLITILWTIARIYIIYKLWSFVHQATRYFRLHADKIEYEESEE